MKDLVTGKFKLFRALLLGAIEHQDTEARISVEQARRLTIYAHETYFRHIRLYDYVLKNTKYCEVKHVTI
jgi:hypothetical protein